MRTQAPSTLTISLTAVTNMTRNQRHEQSRRESRWSMYPGLHKMVKDALQKDNLHLSFHKADENASSSHIFDTHIMGRFTCHNSECGANVWSSKKVPITIRMYPANRYNARVYHQRCQGCDSLGSPSLDKDSYVERVVYRLRKWNGIEVEPRPYYGNVGPPHRSELCEGCRAGHCREGNRALASISYGLANLSF